jgi:hypothetical protein
MASRLIVLLTAAVAFGQAPDARELVRVAVDRELAGASLARNYTWLTDSLEKKYSNDGVLKSTETRTTETLILYGEQFERLIARNGNPLPEAEAVKENARFEKSVDKRAKLSEQDRARADAKAVERDRKDKEFLAQIPDLFRFELLGQEAVNGRAAWIVQATPKPDAKPKGLAASSIAKLHGKLWIDQEDQRWVRVQAEARTTVRFGWFLGSLGEGSRVEFEQVRLNGGDWLPSKTRGKLNARVAVKCFNVETETTYRDYKKFTTGSRILTAEVQPE